MGEEQSTHRRKKKCIQNFCERKPEGKTPLGRPRRRLDDDIRMDHRQIGLEVVNWIHLAQDWDQWHALMNTVMNLQVS
jgi:hypothetical protein